MTRALGLRMMRRRSEKRKAGDEEMKQEEKERRFEQRAAGEGELKVRENYHHRLLWLGLGGKKTPSSFC